MTKNRRETPDDYLRAGKRFAEACRARGINRAELGRLIGAETGERDVTQSVQVYATGRNFGPIQRRKVIKAMNRYFGAGLPLDAFDDAGSEPSAPPAPKAPLATMRAIREWLEAHPDASQATRAALAALDTQLDMEPSASDVHMVATMVAAMEANSQASGATRARSPKAVRTPPAKGRR